MLTCQERFRWPRRSVGSRCLADPQQTQNKYISCRPRRSRRGRTRSAPMAGSAFQTAPPRPAGRRCIRRDRSPNSGPSEIDEWLLAHAGENRLQSGGLGRWINVTREDLNRPRIVAFDRGVDAMRTDLRKRGDAIFVLLLPLERLVEIRSAGRRFYVGQYGVGGSADWLPHDAAAIAQTSRGRRWSGAGP